VKITEVEIFDVRVPPRADHVANWNPVIIRINTYAETYNLHVQPHNCASPVATAAAVQVDVCMPNFIIQEWFPYREEANYALVKEPLEHQVVAGYWQVSDKPGLGVELNDEVIGQYPCLRVTR
jgi:galactonate dehydratase